MEVYYLTAEDVVSIHDDLVAASGHPHAVLYDSKRAEFESALGRPKNLAHYEGADLPTQAVALAIGVSQCQSFADGNKRAAFGAADVFLRVNGWLYSGEPMAMALWLEKYAAEMDRGARATIEADFADWLRANIAPAEDDE